MHASVRILLLSVAAAAGCAFQESIEVVDLHGSVVMPAEAATREYLTVGELTDVRNIGPVYLGLYANVVEGIEAYPHPERGPAFRAPDDDEGSSSSSDKTVGDAYPYGGTTVGDLRYACFEALSCKMVSGRFVDFDDIVSWYADVVGEPLVDAYGAEITNGDYFRQTCYQLLNYTSDAEIRITATRDRNSDGSLDELDLDFVFVDPADADYDADLGFRDGTGANAGYYRGDFTLWQQEFVEGFQLWGFMDSAGVDASFDTCNPSQGYNESTYNRNFQSGAQYQDVLNFPAAYIKSGDWVGSEGVVWTSSDEEPVLRIDYPVE